MKNLSLFIMIMCFCCVVSFATPIETVIYEENITAPLATGWSNDEQTNAGSYGYVHGMWGNNVPSASKTFSLSGNQESITVNFRYWAVDSWDTETAWSSIDSNQIWSKTVTVYNSTSGWGAYSGAFPAPWGNIKRYADVEVTYNTTNTSFVWSFGSTINQAESDESWGFSALKITENIVTPELSSLLIFSIGLAGFFFFKKHKK